VDGVCLSFAVDTADPARANNWFFRTTKARICLQKSPSEGCIDRALCAFDICKILKFAADDEFERGRRFSCRSILCLVPG
jgi:hypothetical protein